MNERGTYWYEVRQEDGWWIVTVPDLGLTTQAKHLRDTDRMARSIISLHLDVPADSIEVLRSNLVGLPQPVADKVHRAVDARAMVAKVQSEANDATVDAARALVGAGVPLRDAGYLLGISHQRVAQILDVAVVQRVKGGYLAVDGRGRPVAVGEPVAKENAQYVADQHNGLRGVSVE